nr:hypothetical protein [uncultured Chitinophaga sp.]
MRKTPPQIFLESVLSICGLLILSIVLYFREGMEKEAIQKITGRITYFEKSFGNHPPARHQGKCRYIRLDINTNVFEVFVGKDKGDFKPDMEKIDELHTGDEVTIYVDNLMAAQDGAINSNVRYIDKGNEPVFIRGNWIKKLILFVMGICTATLLLLGILKSKGKIE